MIKFIAVRWFTNPLHLLPVNLVLSLVMLVALHGSSAFKILLIMAINYLIARTFRGSWLSPVLTWTFNGLVLFSNDIYHGYRFSSLSSSFSYLVQTPCISNTIANFFRQDNFTGVYPRWNVIFNITMLRLISFNMDYYWACKNPANAEVCTFLT